MSSSEARVPGKMEGWFDPEQPFLWGFGLSTFTCLLQLYFLVDATGSLSFFFKPAELLFTLWIIAPIACAGWWAATSFYGLIGLVPIAIFGSLMALDVAYDTSSSTSALGWLFFPPLEWAWLFVAFILAAILKRLV